MFTKSHQPDGPAKRARVVMSNGCGRCRCSMFGLALAVVLLSALVADKLNDANKMKKTQKLLVSALAAIEEKDEEMRLAIDKRWTKMLGAMRR